MRVGQIGAVDEDVELRSRLHVDHQAQGLDDGHGHQCGEAAIDAEGAGCEGRAEEILERVVAETHRRGVVPAPRGKRQMDKAKERHKDTKTQRHKGKTQRHKRKTQRHTGTKAQNAKRKTKNKTQIRHGTSRERGAPQRRFQRIHHQLGFKLQRHARTNVLLILLALMQPRNRLER
eukprot:scaffold578_cov243-Pinguiococcus_pyrenoidosus.AAC.25